MPVDASIYANAVPQQTNPLQLFGQVAGIQNAQNQNRLFGQEFAARQAVGQAYQNALDPTTGQIDVNKLVAGVANNPAAAFKAGEVGQQALAQQQGQTALDASKVDLYNKHLDTITRQLTPLLVKGAQGTLTPDDVYGAAGRLIADPNSQINAQNIGPILSGMPSGPNGAPATSAQLNDWVTRLALQNENGRQQVAAIKGSPMLINRGGQQQFVAPSAVTGITTAISPQIANTVSPAEKMASNPSVVTRRNPQTGAMETVPVLVSNAARFDQYGDPLPQGGAGGPAFGPNGGNYAPPNAGANPPATAIAPPPTAALPPGVIQTGAALGAETRANARAAGNVGQEMDFQKSDSVVPAQKAALSNMLDDLQKFTPGKGAAATYDVKAFLQRNAPTIASAFNVSPDNIAAQESFGKLANQIQLAQEAQLSGAGTDTSRSIIHGANPNDTLSKEGNINMIHMLQGNADALAALHNKWSAIKKANPDADYGDFVADNAKNFDPRVFQAQYLDKAGRAKLIASMPPQERLAFGTTYQFARDNGFIPGPPGGQNGGQ